MGQVIQTKPFAFGVAQLPSTCGMIRKTGYSNTVTNVKQDISPMGGIYVFPAAGGIQMQVVSDSTEDDVGGTGVTGATIMYLDADYVQQTETIIMDGKTPVITTATDILRINHFFAHSVGTNNYAVGNISLQAVGGVTTYSKIAAETNNSLQAIFTIPAGYTGYISHFQINSGVPSLVAYARISLMSTANHTGVSVSEVFTILDTVVLQNTNSEIIYTIPLTMPEKTDIKVVGAISAATVSTISVGFFGWFEPT